MFAKLKTVYEVFVNKRFFKFAVTPAKRSGASCGRSAGGFAPKATYFLCEQKVGKESFRDENTDSTSGAEGRALAHSIFPLKARAFLRKR